MRQRTNRAACILPCGAREAGKPVLLGDGIFVEALRGELAWRLAVLYDVRDDGWEDDVAAKVSREVTCGG